MIYITQRSGIGRVTINHSKYSLIISRFPQFCNIQFRPYKKALTIADHLPHHLYRYKAIDYIKIKFFS